MIGPWTDHTATVTWRKFPRNPSPTAAAVEQFGRELLPDRLQGTLAGWGGESRKTGDFQPAGGFPNDPTDQIGWDLGDRDINIRSIDNVNMSRIAAKLARGKIMPIERLGHLSPPGKPLRALWLVPKKVVVPSRKAPSVHINGASFK